MVGFHKYLLKKCFNFFSLTLTGTDEMQYKKTKKGLLSVIWNQPRRFLAQQVVRMELSQFV